MTELRWCVQSWGSVNYIIAASLTLWTQGLRCECYVFRLECMFWHLRT